MERHWGGVCFEPGVRQCQGPIVLFFFLASHTALMGMGHCFSVKGSNRLDVRGSCYQLNALQFGLCRWHFFIPSRGCPRSFSAFLLRLWMRFPLRHKRLQPLSGCLWLTCLLSTAWQTVVVISIFSKGLLEWSGKVISWCWIGYPVPHNWIFFLSLTVRHKKSKGCSIYLSS